MHWYTDVLKKYAVFKGRASRLEYWMFVLFNFCISFVVGFIGGALSIRQLGNLYTFAILIPALAVMVRRLHDTNRSGWWALFLLLPIIGWIVLVILLTSDSQTGLNQYGPNPKKITQTEAPFSPDSKKNSEPRVTNEEEVIINDLPEPKRSSLKDKMN